MLSPQVNRTRKPKWPINNQPTRPMFALATTLLPIAAVGYSIIYLLFGGGLGGAVLIFIIAKALGK